MQALPTLLPTMQVTTPPLPTLVPSPMTLEITPPPGSTFAPTKHLPSLPPSIHVTLPTLNPSLITGILPTLNPSATRHLPTLASTPVLPTVPPTPTTTITVGGSTFTLPSASSVGNSVNSVTDLLGNTSNDVLPTGSINVLLPTRPNNLV